MAWPGVRIVTLEADPVCMGIARNIFASAGLAHVVDVCTGPSKDLLHLHHLRDEGKVHLQFGAASLDWKDNAAKRPRDSNF